MTKTPFNFLLFLAAFNCCCFCSVFAFFAVFAVEESGGPVALTYPFLVLRFPVYNLLFDHFKLDMKFGYFVGDLAINCMLYGLVVERVLMWVKQRAKPTPDTDQPTSKGSFILLDV